MAHKRKTLNVADTVTQLNYRITASDTPEARTAIASVIEMILKDANRYAGYRYTSITFHDDGSNTVHDETYRHYYVKGE